MRAEYLRIGIAQPGCADGHVLGVCHGRRHSCVSFRWVSRGSYSLACSGRDFEALSLVLGVDDDGEACASVAALDGPRRRRRRDWLDAALARDLRRRAVDRAAMLDHDELRAYELELLYWDIRPSMRRGSSRPAPDLDPRTEKARPHHDAERRLIADVDVECPGFARGERLEQLVLRRAHDLAQRRDRAVCALRDDHRRP